MSQKAGRKSKKPSTDEVELESKQPNVAKNGSEEMKASEMVEENGSHDANVTEEKQQIERSDRVTRSQSCTPSKKKKDLEEVLPKNGDIVEKPKDVIEVEQNGNNDVTNNDVKNTDDVIVAPEKENGVADEAPQQVKQDEEETAEVDPQISSDEPDPELQFDDTSDTEQASKDEVATVKRCVTRRSQNRNIPTPKTPKSLEERDGEHEPEVDSYETCSDDVSTQAEVGGDSTRMNFMENDENSFLNLSKGRSFAETVRGLSGRPSIRLSSTDFRKTSVHRPIQNSDLNATYPLRSSIERVSIGRKRKASTDIEPVEEAKRYRPSSGFFARLTQPLSSFRKQKRSAGTPTLTAYKDEHVLVENRPVDIQQVGSDGWCTIM